MVNNMLITARKGVGFTQKELAESVGIDRTAYTRIERGYRKPTVDIAVKIASILGKQVEELFSPIDVNENHNSYGEKKSTRTCG